MDFSLAFDSCVNPARPICLAISGGVDSVVLAHKAKEWALKKGAEITAIHVNHGLSKNADYWSDFVSKTCDQLGISLQVKMLDIILQPGDSLEAVARSARYKALRDMSPEGAQICTAHHLDDQLETMLLALKRGAGAIRLGGMSEVLNLDDGRSIVRPFLSIQRKVIEDAAISEGMEWVEDESNLDSAFDRNFLRNEIIPLLKRRWPGILSSAARSSATLQSEQKIVEIHASQILKRCMTEDLHLMISEIDQLHQEERKLAIRYWIRANGLIPPREDRLDQIYFEVAKARLDRNPKFQAHNWIVTRKKDLISISKF